MSLFICKGLCYLKGKVFGDENRSSLCFGGRGGGVEYLGEERVLQFGYRI